MTEERLDRIEQKLDRLGEAVVALARMEERMVTLFKRMDLYDERHLEMNRRLNDLEKAVGSNGYFVRFIERIFWIVLSAAVATAFYWIK